MKEILNFDQDMQQILYKLEEEVSLHCQSERNPEAGIQHLGKYNILSVGKTAKELEEEGQEFFQIREVVNDYNGPHPSYALQHIKLLYGADFTLFGAQLIGEGNFEERSEVLKKVIEKKESLEVLSKTSIFGRPIEEELDILNLAAFYGMDQNRNWLPVEKVREFYEKGAFFLDVREEEEHEYARLLGSKNIPLRNLMLQLSQIPKDRDVYVYCRSAHRSLDAVNFLKTLGYDRVYNVEGGFIALSYEEYTKDKEQNREKILSSYHFE